MQRLSKRFRAILIISACSIQPVLAATSVPLSVDPGRLLKEFGVPESPENQEIKPYKSPESSKKSSEAQEFQFKLSVIHLVGNSVFSEQELITIYQKELGTNVTVTDLNRITNSITLKYRNAGYILARAILPEQQIKDGIVQIKIIEGYIANENVAGNVKPVKGLLESYAASAARSNPLKITELEHYLLLANDIPGVTVKSLLYASKTEQGAADLTFVAELERAEGMFALDNRGTKFLGPVQYFLRGNINSFYTEGDTLGLKTLVARDPSQLSFLQVYQQHPWGEQGLYGVVSARYIHTRPGSTLRPLSIAGSANAFAYELSYPTLRSREKSLFLSIAFDVLDSKTDAVGVRLFNDHLRSLRLNATYVQEDQWKGISTIRASLGQGLPIFSANSQHAKDVSRPGGRSAYTKLQLSLSRLQALKQEFSFFTDLRLQYAFVKLLSPEQFSYGGQQFGGAYDSSELTGDHGMVGKFEFRYTKEPTHSLKYIKLFQPYVYYDFGVLWSPVQVPQRPKVMATATGLGLRVHFKSKTYLQGEVTQPLSRPTSVKQLHGKGPRIFISFHQTL